MAGAARTVVQSSDDPAITSATKAFVQIDEIFVDKGHDLSLALFLDGDLRINQPPGFANPGLQLRLAINLDGQLCIEASQFELGLLSRLHEFEDFVLHSPDFGLQELNFTTEIVGVASAQPTRIQPHLLGFGLFLGDLEFAARFVDGELDLAHAGGGFVTGGSDTHAGLVCGPVVDQFGKALTLIDQPVDVGIDIL